MNRLANAFSSAIPGSGSVSGSDGSSSIQLSRDSPRVSSPFEPSFSVSGHSGIALRPSTSERGGPRDSSVGERRDRDRSRSMERRHHNINTIYDDPRTIYHPASSYGGSANNSGFALLGGSLNRPSRPGLLRHLTDDGASTPRARSTSSSREAREARERDKSVRANLTTNNGNQRRGWGMASAGQTRLSAMAQGPDGKYAVGGGQYLRVFQIFSPTSGNATPMLIPEERKPHLAKGPGGFSVGEVVNLWKNSWPVGKGVNDVTWGTGAFFNKIATATPSGHLLLFDVEKGKLEQEVTCGTRPMNTVRFCPVPASGHMILTGGTDGAVRMIDMRADSPIVRKPLKHSAPITSLCFAPDKQGSFVVGIDDGSIWRYDMRSATRSVGKAFGAHGGKAVMDLRWKEADERSGDEGNSAGGGWLASAGADKIVQIWDMSQSWDKPPTPIHTLHTSHPIRRIAWRPGHSSELVVVPLPKSFQSSSSLDVTASPKPDDSGSSQDDVAHLEIWHARRHYVAKYAIPISDGGAVDVAWSEGDEALVACFQNGAFAQIHVRGRNGVGAMALPLDTIPRQVVGWSPRGELVYALDKFKPGEIPFDEIKREYANHWDKVGRQPATISDKAYEPLQSMGTLSMPDPDQVEFAYLAHWYKLEGATPERLCQWNKDVALWCGRTDDARLWSFLKLLIEEFTACTHEGTFDEEVFSQPLQGTAILPDPLEISPTGSGSHTPGQRLRSRSRSRSRLRNEVTAIPLQKIHHTTDDEGNTIQSSSSRSSSSSSSSCSTGESSGSDSDSECSSDTSKSRSRSRFVTFVPPDEVLLQRSERNGSIATIIPSSRIVSASTSKQDRDRDRNGPSDSSGSSSSSSNSTSTLEREKEKMTQSQILQKSESTGRTKSRANGSSKKSSTLGKMTASRILSASDWPDPYGITPTQDSSSGIATATATGTGSGTPLNKSDSNRSSPIPLLSDIMGGVSGKGIRSSPLPLQSKRDSEDTNTNTNNYRGLEELKNSLVQIPLTKIARARDGEEKFEKSDWEQYKIRRIQGLLQWWESLVNDGETQLATTIFAVASCIATFPEKQCERLAHAYVEMLDRHRLHLASAYIRRYSQIPSLEITSQDEGMTHIIHCEKCGKSTGSLEDIGVQGKTFWICKRCKVAAKTCAVCRRTAKGLWMGCRKCSHGGHQACMRLYYGHTPLIPTSSNNGISNDKDGFGYRPTTITGNGNGNALSGVSMTSLSSTGIGTVLDLDHEGEDARSTNTTADLQHTNVNTVNAGGAGWARCPTGCGCNCRYFQPVI